MAVHDLIANSQFSLLAGTSGTATVPAGYTVTGAQALSLGGGTLVITPKGAGQAASALPTITLPANTAWWNAPTNVFLTQISAPSTFVFAGTDSYIVWLAKVGV